MRKKYVICGIMGSASLRNKRNKIPKSAHKMIKGKLREVWRCYDTLNERRAFVHGIEDSKVAFTFTTKTEHDAIYGKYEIPGVNFIYENLELC